MQEYLDRQLVTSRRASAQALLRFVRDGGDLRRRDVVTHVETAVRDYRLRFPDSKATSPWLFYDGNPLTKVIRGTPERVDVYCTFCRVLLVHPAIWQHDYSDQLRAHTTICALKSLAQLMEPGAPGTYVLPTEVP
jgi:hypothetical protein